MEWVVTWIMCLRYMLRVYAKWRLTHIFFIPISLSLCVQGKEPQNEVWLTSIVRSQNDSWLSLSLSVQGKEEVTKTPPVAGVGGVEMVVDKKKLKEEATFLFFFWYMKQTSQLGLSTSPQTIQCNYFHPLPPLSICIPIFFCFIHRDFV